MLRGIQATSPTDKEIVMSQNLISLALTAEQLTAIEGALATLEENLTGQELKGTWLIKFGRRLAKRAPYLV